MGEVNTGDAVLDEIVRRIVAVADPDKIILFGSRARGDAREDSDYDVLVIGDSPESKSRRTVPIFQATRGIKKPFDVVWCTPEEIDEWRNVRSFFITTAVEEGRVVYERAT